jgi:hypothetical protein
MLAGQGGDRTPFTPLQDFVLKEIASPGDAAPHGVPPASCFTSAMNVVGRPFIIARGSGIIIHT